MFICIDYLDEEQKWKVGTLHSSYGPCEVCHTTTLCLDAPKNITTNKTRKGGTRWLIRSLNKIPRRM